MDYLNIIRIEVVKIYFILLLVIKHSIVKTKKKLVIGRHYEQNHIENLS